jgi:hypothetical protein
MYLLKLEDRPVQWLDGDAHMVGKRFVHPDGALVEVDDVYDNATDQVVDCWLAQLAQPASIVLVRRDDKTLCPYPSSPIPEPTNTGRKQD